MSNKKDLDKAYAAGLNEYKTVATGAIERLIKANDLLIEIKEVAHKDDLEREDKIAQIQSLVRAVRTPIIHHVNPNCIDPSKCKPHGETGPVDYV